MSFTHWLKIDFAVELFLAFTNTLSCSDRRKRIHRAGSCFVCGQIMQEDGPCALCSRALLTEPNFTVFLVWLWSRRVDAFTQYV